MPPPGQLPGSGSEPLRAAKRQQRAGKIFFHGEKLAPCLASGTVICPGGGGGIFRGGQGDQPRSTAGCDRCSLPATGRVPASRGRSWPEHPPALGFTGGQSHGEGQHRALQRSRALPWAVRGGGGLQRQPSRRCSQILPDDLLVLQYIIVLVSSAEQHLNSFILMRTASTSPPRLSDGFFCITSLSSLADL